MPILPARGFNSLTKMYAAAEAFTPLIEQGKQIVVLHVVDYDPGGQTAADVMERDMLKLFDCKISFRRLAIRDRILANISNRR